MARRVTMAVIVALLLSAAGENPAWGATSLLVSQSVAFSVLGHSCGGIRREVGMDSNTSMGRIRLALLLADAARARPRCTGPFKGREPIGTAPHRGRGEQGQMWRGSRNSAPHSRAV